MTAYDYLNSIYKTSLAIDRKQQKYNAILAQVTKTVPTLSKVSNGGVHNPQSKENALCKLADMSIELAVSWDELAAKKAEARKHISQIPDCKCRRLLIYRYIDFMPWSKVAREIGASKDHARGYLNKKAIQYLENLLT